MLQAQLDTAQASYDQALRVLWGLVVFEVALVVGVVVHELGHAVMARRAGLPIRMVRIGTGWPLLRWRVGRAWVVVRALPFSGSVQVLMPRATSLAGAAGFLLGGIAANAVVLAAAGLMWLLAPGAGWWPVPVGMAQAVLILGTAVPHTWRGRHGQRQRSDGERLRRLRRDGSLWSASAAQTILAQRLALTEPVPAPSQAWAEIAYQVARPERLMETWARQDACTILRALLDDSAPTWFERLVAWDEMVLHEAVHGECAITAAELDAWSAAALARAPTRAVQVARVGALCRLDRWDEAEVLLGPWTGSAESRDAYARLFALRIRTARAKAKRDDIRSAI